MTFRSLNAWNLTPAEALAEQRRLAPEVVTTDRLGEVHRVAGIDVGYEDDGAVTRAAVAVLDYPSLALLETAIVRVTTRFPYIPGLLSFREAPAVLEALEKLAALPDLLLYDGHGLAHPRRFGIACHVGLVADIPTIGVAKSRLTGEYAPVPQARGSWMPLTQDGEIIGAVLRTREAVAPVFVSIGHRMSLETAIRYTLACAPRYRLPETTRQAHRLASHRSYFGTMTAG